MGLHISDLVTLTDSGLYCEAGDFYIDPWKPVSKALITHAHSDHARAGSASYLTAAPGAYLLKARLPEHQSRITAIGYRDEIVIRDARVSFYPAGHVLGSSQIRIEHRGEVWVVSGDYKVQPDSTCAPFDPVRCHTFITESTFGLPIYRWEEPATIFAEINSWWQANKDAGKASVLFCYALGKAQRILASIDGSIGLVYTHGSVERLNGEYRTSGVNLPATSYVKNLSKGTTFGGSLILAPPSANGTPWLRQFGSASTAFASGWMRIRGARRRRAIDRGFVLSDHADWPGLQSVIKATEAQRVIVTHGNVNAMVRWLQEQGLRAESFSTKFAGELDEVEIETETQAKDTQLVSEEAIENIDQSSDLSEAQ